MKSSHLFPNRRAAIVAMTAMCAITAGAQTRPADSFPNKPIQLVFPFPPGGGMDPVFRALAEAASKELGQPVVLINNPGAGGVMGTASVAARLRRLQSAPPHPQPRRRGAGRTTAPTAAARHPR